MRIAVVGSGFAGLGMAVRLKQAGFNDFSIFEIAESVGGTWRDNRYPGAACDVESALYSFSFAPNPNWSRMFATQPEIRAYLEDIVDRFGLRSHLRLNCGVASAVFDEGQNEWSLTLTDGTRERAKVLVAGTGGLARPSLPDIRGIVTFGATLFHSARWHSEATFAGKRVAVIGTGASAIQIVPELAKDVAQLAVYQRTAPWVIPKADRAMTEEEREGFRLRPWRQRLLRTRLYWQHEALAFAFIGAPKVLKWAGKLAQRILERRVKDPVLRAKVQPNYTLGCKRILLSNNYYPALQQPNVEVVTAPIREITATGITTSDGQARAFDAIILATGFHAADAVAPFPITGLAGRDLNETWGESAEAYLGSAVAGFPNLFLIVGPNTGLGHSSMVFMIESQVAYILSALQRMRRDSLDRVEVRPEVQRQYNDKLHARFPRTVWNSGCVSWYRTKSGKNTTLWPGFTFEFRRRTRRFDVENYAVIPL